MPPDRPTPIPAWKTAAFSLLVSVALFSVFFWPLPRYLDTAIVAGCEPPRDVTTFSPTVPGDQLQLMYHFWMFTDMLAGHTPWFYNLYEFNTGDDRERFEPQPYYFPFSLFYAVGHTLANPVVGWNLAGFLSIWLTLWLHVVLIRRYTTRESLAWLFALLALSLPYRWMTLGAGSPTGFAMAWPPLLLIGLDRWFLDRRLSGAWLAGVAILLASWGDTHTFFFCVLLTPAWVLLLIAYRWSQHQPLPGRADLIIALKGAGPFLLFLAAAYGVQKVITGIKTSRLPDGRPPQEVALFSPTADGFLSWHAPGVSEHIYLGIALAALAVFALVTLAAGLARPASRRATLRLLPLAAVLTIGITVLLVLTLGPFGWNDGLLFRGARKLIHPYTMIRQPAKIFSILPVLIAATCALAWRLNAIAWKRPAAGAALLVAIAVGGVIEAERRIHPVLTFVASEQGAYAAVADDAATRGKEPRALVVTLWPGDTHDASIYQHFASTYHIRMVNGYRPFVSAEYIDQIFNPLQSVNLGLIDAAQADWLRERGIRYILVHENIYPEKVSPFPVAYALANLLDSPDLEFLHRDGSVWAFRLRERATHAPRDAAPRPAAWPVARVREAERLRHVSPRMVVKDPAAQRKAYIRLDQPGLSIGSRPWDIAPADGLAWAFRLRGEGRLRLDRFVEDAPAGSLELTVASPDWHWMRADMPTPETRRQATFALTLLDGTVEFDQVLMTTAPDPLLAPGETWSIAAAHLYRAGFSTPALDAVVFDPAIERNGILLYGPKQIFPAGTYRLRVDFATDAPAGTVLGEWNIETIYSVRHASVPFIAGQPLETTFTHPETLPLNLVMVLFAYDHPVTVSRVHLDRLD